MLNESQEMIYYLPNVCRLYHSRYFMQRVCHMKRIHTWSETTQWAQHRKNPWVYLPSLKLSVSLPPQKSHPSYPRHNHTLAQNEQKITALCSACHPLMETRNSLEFRELEAGHMHYTLDTAIYLHSWYFEVSCMLFSFPEINLLKKKKKKREKPTVFQGDQKPISGNTMNFDSKRSH